MGIDCRHLVSRGTNYFDYSGPHFLPGKLGKNNRVPAAQNVHNCSRLLPLLWWSWVQSASGCADWYKHSFVCTDMMHTHSTDHVLLRHLRCSCTLHIHTILIDPHAYPPTTCWLRLHILLGAYFLSNLSLANFMVHKCTYQFCVYLLKSIKYLSSSQLPFSTWCPC